MRILARAAVATVAGLIVLGYLYMATAPVHNSDADVQALREKAAQYEVGRVLVKKCHLSLHIHPHPNAHVPEGAPGHTGCS